MIKKTSIVLATTLLIFGAFASCAKKSTSITGALSKESFNAWIQKNAPAAKKLDGDVYLEFKERSPYWEHLDAPKLDTSWLQLNLTAYTFSVESPQVIGTRNSELARLIGSWEYTTHFVPDVLLYKYESYGVICPGLAIALQYMRAGDKARVYIPADLMLSSTTFTTGYALIENYTGYPVYYDVELVDVIDKPTMWEENVAFKYAANNWRYTRSDTVAAGLYMRTIVSNPTGNPITLDSTVRMFQVLRFLDGQLLSTNIDSVAANNHYKGLEQTSSSYSVLKLSPTDFDGDEYMKKNLIYRKILPLMRTGEQVEVVATSAWGLGNAGAVDNVPQIGAYEPLHYMFRILGPDESDSGVKE